MIFILIKVFCNLESISSQNNNSNDIVSVYKYQSINHTVESKELNKLINNTSLDTDSVNRTVPTDSLVNNLARNDRYVNSTESNKLTNFTSKITELNHQLVNITSVNT